LIDILIEISRMLKSIVLMQQQCLNKVTMGLRAYKSICRPKYTKASILLKLST